MSKINSMSEVDKAIDMLLSKFRIQLSIAETVEDKNKVQERTKVELFEFICKLTED